MERLKRSPATWGLSLGGAIVVASTFFAWLEVENRGGDEGIAAIDTVIAAIDTVAIDTVAGQTILFLGAVAVLCGLLVTVSLGKGKYVWATVGLLAAGVVAAAALWGLVDADRIAARFADLEEFSTTITIISPDSPGDVVSQSFDEGTLSAQAAIGLFIGLGGGVLAVLGAFLSYRFTPPVAG